MICYKIDKWGKEPIVAVEIVKETRAFVELPSGRREAKRDTYFSTFSEAQEYLSARLKDKMSGLRVRLEECAKDLAFVEAMTDPAKE